MLKQESVRIQYMLKKLRNPLKLKLPPKPTGVTDSTSVPPTAPRGTAAAAAAAAFGAGLTANAGAVTAAAIGATAMSSSTPVTTSVKLNSSNNVVEEKPIEKPSNYISDETKQQIPKK